MPSAEELAKYILTTGDENSVVELIEEMVDSQQVDDQIYKSIKDWNTIPNILFKLHQINKLMLLKYS